MVKPVRFLGSSLDDLRDFPDEARQRYRQIGGKS